MAEIINPKELMKWINEFIKSEDNVGDVILKIYSERLPLIKIVLICDVLEMNNLIEPECRQLILETHGVGIYPNVNNFNSKKMKRMKRIVKSKIVKIVKITKCDYTRPMLCEGNSEVMKQKMGGEITYGYMLWSNKGNVIAEPHCWNIINGEWVDFTRQPNRETEVTLIESEESKPFFSGNGKGVLCV